MKRPRIEFTKGTDNTAAVIVNSRYLIYLDTGVVYDTERAKDIPQYVFDIRDKIIECLDDLKKTCNIDLKVSE